MIKKIILASSLLMFLMNINISAQVIGQCGTVSQEWRDNITNRLLENKRLVKDGLVQQRNAVTYVPITFHLIADNSGNGRIPETSVLNMLCRMNDDYFDQEVQFYIHNGFNYIDNTSAYTGPSSFTGGLKMRSEKVSGTVNIYIAQNADTAGIILAVVLAVVGAISEGDTDPFSLIMAVVSAALSGGVGGGDDDYDYDGGDYDYGGNIFQISQVACAFGVPVPLLC